MLRWMICLAIAAGACKKHRKPPVDAAVTIDAPTPSVQSKLDAAARIKGDIHAPRLDEESQKKPPR